MRTQSDKGPVKITQNIKRGSQSEKIRRKHSLSETQRKDMKLAKLVFCSNTVIATPVGSYITQWIDYTKWEKNNNFRKWLLR